MQVVLMLQQTLNSLIKANIKSLTPYKSKRVDPEVLEMELIWKKWFNKPWKHWARPVDGPESVALEFLS